MENKRLLFGQWCHPGSLPAWLQTERKEYVLSFRGASEQGSGVYTGKTWLGLVKFGSKGPNLKLGITIIFKNKVCII